MTSLTQDDKTPEQKIPSTGGIHNIQLEKISFWKNKENQKKYLKFLVKVILTVGSLYFVFHKIDISKFKEAVVQANIFYFVLAFIIFNISKIISAFRLNLFYKAIGLPLNNPYSLKLYYVGMFYNLFLPGSIGGDGYKVYLLNQKGEAKLKNLISATLLDRVSGLVFLLILALVLLLFSTFSLDIPYYKLIIVISILIILPVFYLGIRIFFPNYTKIFWQSCHLSFWVQAGQVACAIFLLLSLSVHEFYADYLALFMFSSIVAVLPLTIGGAGAREMVFLFGVKYLHLHIHESVAIAFALFFFMVTAMTSFIGFFFTFRIDKENK